MMMKKKKKKRAPDTTSRSSPTPATPREAQPTQVSLNTFRRNVMGEVLSCDFFFLANSIPYQIYIPANQKTIGKGAEDWAWPRHC
jgi:hypothetical protein